MKETGDRSKGFDLKCDFPVRESFREALLARLLAMDGREMQVVFSAEDEGHLEEDLGIRELCDYELDMLAAAGGQLYVSEDLLEGSSSQGL